MDIKQLIMQVQLGDEDAFLLLLKKAKFIMIDLCHKYYFTEWDLGDKFQEAQIILYQSIQKVDLTVLSDEDAINQFYGFYYRNLNNHFCNQCRYENAKKRQHLHQKTSYDEQIMSDSMVVREDTARYVATKVSLDEIKKYLTLEECLLITHRLQGHSIKECAAKINRGVNYTSKLLKKIRSTIRDEQIMDSHYIDDK